MGRNLFLAFFLVLLSNTAFGQKEPQRYAYTIRGRIIDENSRPQANMTVCFYPSFRPIGGRIFCVKTDDEGRFSVGERTIPDKYNVCASTSDSLIQTDEKARSVCSKPMTFGAKDESKKVVLKLKPINETPSKEKNKPSQKRPF